MQTSNRTDFPVILGIVETGHELVLDFADSWHTALQGMSRSGKSVLTYTVLAQLAKYPEALITGLDPTGVLLGPFGDSPGAEYRAITTASMENHAAVIAGLVAEMDTRITGLLAAGKDKLDSFSEETPLLVVVLEEYPGVLGAAAAEDSENGRKPAERVKPKIQAGVRRLIQEGAKVGVRVLVLAQRMDAEIVGGAERSNLGNRLTLRVDNLDAVKMLHPMADTDTASLAAQFSPGHGLIGRPGLPTQRFRADYLAYPKYTASVRGGSQ